MRACLLGFGSAASWSASRSSWLRRSCSLNDNDPVLLHSFVLWSGDKLLNLQNRRPWANHWTNLGLFVRFLHLALAWLPAGNTVFVPFALRFKSQTVFFRHLDVTMSLGSRHAIPRPREMLHYLSGRQVGMHLLHDSALLQTNISARC